jgi:aspartokinase-like uncharacterized kinase
MKEKVKILIMIFAILGLSAGNLSARNITIPLTAEIMWTDYPDELPYSEVNVGNIMSDTYSYDLENHEAHPLDALGYHWHNRSMYGDLVQAKYKGSGLQLDWAYAVDGRIGEEIRCEPRDVHVSMDVDRKGNVYVSDSFYGTTDFDPGEGECYITSERGGMFLTKYDVSGKFLWARAVTGWIEDVGGSGFRTHEIHDCEIALDTENNVCATGIFRGTLDFDPGEGEFNLNSDAVGMFFAKYDTSGNFIWARTVNGWYEDLGNNWFRIHEIRDSEIALDTENNVCVTGTFRGTLDFDPGEGEFYLSSEPESMFIAKYDTAGNFIWAHAIGGYYQDFDGGCYQSKIALDKENNVCVTGTFWGTLDFDPSERECKLYSGGAGMFVAKYDTSGDFLWANSVSAWQEHLGGGSWRSHEIEDSEIALDTKNDVYLTGTFWGTLDFDPSEGECKLTSGAKGMFVTKYDMSGNFLWARAVAGRYEDLGGGGFRIHEILDSEIALDTKMNSYVTGTFLGTLDFDTGDRECRLTSEAEGMFIAEYDASGVFLRACAVSGQHENLGGGWWRSHEIHDSKIALHNKRNLYVTGTFWGTLNFDLGEGTYNLTSKPGGMFIAKYTIKGVYKSKYVQATDPYPADGTTGVSINADLRWTAGSYVTSHDVYFGTSINPPFVCNQAATIYDPGTMAYGTTYYWRIDEVSKWSVTTSKLWKFTTIEAPLPPPPSPPPPPPPP